MRFLPRSETHMKRDVQPQKPAPARAGKGFWFLLCAIAFLGVALLAVRAWRSGASDAVVASGSPDQVISPEPETGVETTPPPATAADHPASAPKVAPVPPPRIPAPELPAAS